MWLGRLLVIISVVLNLFSVWVKVSRVLVMMLCVVSGSEMWKNIVVGVRLSMCVVFFSCGFMFLNVVCVVLCISGKVVSVVVIIVFC